MKLFLVCLFLTLAHVAFSQTNSSKTNAIDEFVVKVDQRIKTFDVISMYFIFDTGMKGRIMTKNTFLDISVDCTNRFNDEGRAEFYFERDSLRLIVHYDYDPVEASSSRTLRYYFRKNQLVFIQDQSEEDLTHFEVGKELQRRYVHAKDYFSGDVVIKSLTKETEATSNETTMSNFEKVPFKESATIDQFRITNKDQLLTFIKEGWISNDRVKF
jgi:hypothetical protein